MKNKLSDDEEIDKAIEYIFDDTVPSQCNEETQKKAQLLFNHINSSSL